MVISRFAPSPTGSMHIGNLRTALYSYLWAKQNNGKFILRIEDTDQKRSTPENIEDIKATLSLFHLDPDEIFIQSERLPIYQYYAYSLLQQGKAYMCNCASDQTEPCNCANQAMNKYSGLVNKNFCIKLKVQGIGEIKCKDASKLHSTYFHSNDLYDIVLLKSDGFPTYHLASVVDDHLMGITDVFRGSEWLSSLPYHTLLYRFFHWDIPNIYHLPLILKPDGSKFSKRDGDASINHMIYTDCILPSAIINYIALLGWHPSDNREMFSLEELIQEFSTSRLTNSAARFDAKKLRKVNLWHANTSNGRVEFNNIMVGFQPENEVFLERLYDVFKKGTNLVALFQGFVSYDWRHRLDITRDNKRLAFLTDFLRNIEKYDDTLPSDHVMPTDMIECLFEFLPNTEYSSKEFNEYIRWAMTDKITGLPAKTLIGLVSIKTMKNMLTESIIYETHNETAKVKEFGEDIGREDKIEQETQEGKA